MADGRHYLVSFEDVSATCGGVDISAISEMRITAQTNGVPKITLLVDGGNSDGTGSIAADGVSLDSARVIFDTCRSMLRTSSALLSLSLTCRTVGAGGEYTQSLHLDGWMLVDVALSPVRRNGVCTASLTFAHPLYKANLGGAMPGNLVRPPLFSGVSGRNPLEVFVAALKAYAQAPRLSMPNVVVPGAASLVDIEPVLVRHLSTAISDLTSALSWKGASKLPAASVLGAHANALWYGIAAYGTPSAGNSVLHSLLAGLVPECSLAVGGDFLSKSLDIGPFTPWADASFRIGESDIVGLDFPQTDPAPLSGIHLITIDSGGKDSVSFNFLGGQLGDGAKPVDIFYVPDSEKAAEYMYGPIQQFSMPGWLQQTLAYSSNMLSRNSSDAVGAQEGSWSCAASIPRDGTAGMGGGSAVAPALDFARASLLCAKAYFETSYMKDWAFGVTTRFMLSQDGVTLCPGRVVSVTTDSGEIVGGYVNTVEHTISVASRSAVTKIRCTHPRFGERPSAITSGDNALYS